MISQDHIKLRYDVINTSITIAMVKNNATMLVSTFIAHIKYNYTTTYRKAWLAKQWATNMRIAIGSNPMRIYPNCS